MNSDLALLIAVALLLLGTYFNCKVAVRLGYGGFAGVLLMVPVLNLFVWAAWALMESPTERELRYLREENARLKR